MEKMRMLAGQRLTIGKLAELTDSNVPTIRYYEEIGLLPPAVRTSGGQRAYGPPDLERLTFIRRCRDFGFPLEQVRTLLTLTEKPDRNCTEARDVAQSHLDTVREKLKELRALERSLVDFVKSCDSSCAGGPAGECTIMDDLHSRPATAANFCS